MQIQQNLVAEFNRSVGDNLPSTPSLIKDRKLVVLLGDLLKEECDETFKAMWSGNIEEIAKELADVVYVVCNIANQHGIPLQRVFEEVHTSNMTKVTNPERNKAGKIIKGKNYRPPNLSFLRNRSR